MSICNKIAVVSDAVPEVCKALKEYGFTIINTDRVNNFISYEQKHADMQCISVGEQVFVLSCCNNLSDNLNSIGINTTLCGENISQNYPRNICLNAKLIGNNLIGKLDFIDKKLLEHCVNTGYKLINVNQGYTACSITKVTDNAVITADDSIYKELTKEGINVLKINCGNINLFGSTKGEYGFIGGASVLVEDKHLLFFGDVTKHPNYTDIKYFCNSNGVDIKYINNIDLCDIGGVTLLINSQSKETKFYR